MKFIIKNRSLHKRCAQSDPGAIFISSKVGVFDAIKGLCKSKGLLSASKQPQLSGSLILSIFADNDNKLFGIFSDAV